MEKIIKYCTDNKRLASFYIVGSYALGEDNFKDYDIVISPKKEGIGEKLLDEFPKREVDGKNIDVNIIHNINDYLNSSSSQVKRSNIRGGKYNVETVNLYRKKQVAKGLNKMPIKSIRIA